MEQVKLLKPFSSFSEFEKFINEEIKIDVIYKVPNFYFETIKIETENEEDEGQYCWALNKNFYVAGSTGVLFPMKSTNYVKFFKTVEGCKKNLLEKVKSYDFIWKKSKAYQDKLTPVDAILDLAAKNEVEKNKMITDYKNKLQANINFYNTKANRFGECYNELSLLLNSYGVTIKSIDSIHKSENYTKPNSIPQEIFEDTQFYVAATLDINKVRSNKLVIKQFIDNIRTAIKNRFDDEISFYINQFSLAGQRIVECKFYMYNKKGEQNEK